MNWRSLSEAIAASANDKSVVLRNLRAPDAALPPDLRSQTCDGLGSIDLMLAGGRISGIFPAGTAGQDGLNMGKRMIWPAAVDCHTHIDKGQVWPRGSNPDGTFTGAVEASGADSAGFQSAEDILARAEFSLSCAYAHGTALLRTHVDADPATFDTRFGVLQELAQDWAGRLEVQLCPFTGILNEPEWTGRLVQAAKTTKAATLSFFLQQSPDLDRGLDAVFRAAIEHDVSLDFHADENLDPDSNCLLAIAQAALRHGYERPVLVGHCCALSVQDAARVVRTLDLVAKARIGIVALPLCNMYLQDRRADRSPRQRGIAPLKEIRERAIPVAIASDNVRDAFYAYGDLDVPDLFRDAMRMMQLDHPVGDWPATVTTTAATLIGRADVGRLQVGGPADLILFSARNWSEFAARPAHDRLVIRAGVMIDTTLPDFAKLDKLEGISP